ncbi:MAG TPA: bifunctional transaldolase/phosoglucose isomerase [Pyrinomonadaceae bacterium]|nr:bifunctional transaldolase/phosoglucose isomerase [Pyrinomonadaceae bacterium]
MSLKNTKFSLFKVMLNQLTYSLPEKLETAVQTKFDDWQKENKISRVWEKDASVWTNDDEAKWLGWLDIAETELSDVQKYRDFAEDVEDFSDVALLGMGGSSLCPEVFSITFGKQNFHILDSTVPAQIKTLESKIDLAKTLFIVASKSGSTLEPNTFKQYFFQKVSQVVGKENAGKQFIAITDPNSKMQQVAERDNFRKIFFGNSEIGGRFSALSVFGLVPASAMRIDVEDFLTRTMEMVQACRNNDPSENPGAILGTILGVCQTSGRDKLTIFTSKEIYDVGAWLEQLIAESTGKSDISIIPVDREKIQPPKNYGNDRVFAYLKLKDDSDEQEDAIAELEKAGQPVVRIQIADKLNLGQEFFRWEFATAVAGSIMQINTFNQPDVESAKIEAKKLTEEYERTGKLPDEKPFYEENGIKLFADERNLTELNKTVGNEKSLKSYLKAHLDKIKENDYFALLAYIEMNRENENLLQEIRHQVLQEKRVATCLGFGPRFLHSTGQAYKGGANEGVFLQVTSNDATDLRVPGQKYTFGIVKAAQARGDFQVLLDRSRRALRVHLGENAAEDLRKLAEIIC